MMERHRMLRKAMEFRGITPTEMGECIGRSRSTVSRYVKQYEETGTCGNIVADREFGNIINQYFHGECASDTPIEACLRRKDDIMEVERRIIRWEDSFKSLLSELNRKYLGKEDEGYYGELMSGLSEEDSARLSKNSIRGLSLLIELYGLGDCNSHTASVKHALEALVSMNGIDLETVLREPSSADVELDAAKERVLRIIRENEEGEEGTPRKKVLEIAASEGIDERTVEKVALELLDEGLIYEPNLRNIKAI